MRSIRHWTPRYIYNRLAEITYQKRHTDHPWLTKYANLILASYLKPSDVGVEFGSGRSTLWFAKRVSYLTSVEHDEVWFKGVEEMIKTSRLINVELIFAPKDVPDQAGDSSRYVRILDKIAREKLDFALIDGVYRDYCALGVIEKLRPNGVLIIDNVNWYLPSMSFSPNSRRPNEGPNGQVWRRVHEIIKDWRCIWTSSGVTDTALFFKPCL